MLLELGSAAALTAQLGRYAPGQFANARTRTGKAQLTGRTLDMDAFVSSPVCGNAFAPLMSPWCANGDVPTAANLNHNEADAAADLGRKRVHHSISDARRLVNSACARWYPVVVRSPSFFHHHCSGSA